MWRHYVYISGASLLKVWAHYTSLDVPDRLTRYAEVKESAVANCPRKFPPKSSLYHRKRGDVSGSAGYECSSPHSRKDGVWTQLGPQNGRATNTCQTSMQILGSNAPALMRIALLVIRHETFAAHHRLLSGYWVPPCSACVSWRRLMRNYQQAASSNSWPIPTDSQIHLHDSGYQAYIILCETEHTTDTKAQTRTHRANNFSRIPQMANVPQGRSAIPTRCLRRICSASTPGAPVYLVPCLAHCRETKAKPPNMST